MRIEVLFLLSICRVFADDLQSNFDLAPSWSSIDQTQLKSKGDILMKSVLQLKRISVIDVRTLVEHLMKKSYDAKTDDKRIGFWSKVFIINRFYFNVPDKLEVDSHQFGGWLKDNSPGKQCGLLWPFRTTQDGSIIIANTFNGYTGADYRGLQEFDNFNSSYGLRYK